MSKVYFVSTHRSTPDDHQLAAYMKAAAPIMAKHGARVIARGMPLATMEAGLRERAGIIEWPSLEEVLAVYDSDEYREVLAHLGPNPQRDIRIIGAA